MLVKISVFNIFCVKSRKKEEKAWNLLENSEKMVFDLCSGANTNLLVGGFIPTKNTFLVVKITQIGTIRRGYNICPSNFTSTSFFYKRHWHLLFWMLKLTFVWLFWTSKCAVHKQVNPFKEKCLHPNKKRGKAMMCFVKEVKMTKKLHLKCLVMFTFVLVNWPWQKLPWLTNKNTFCCCRQP